MHPRGRLHLGDPRHGACDIDESLERCDCLLATQGDAAEAFDPIEEALDQMPFLVEHPIQGTASCTAAVALDLGYGVQIIGDEAAQCLGVVSGIGDNMADPGKTCEQPFSLRAVSPVTRCDLEPDRQAKCIHRGMDLGRQTAAGTSDRVSLKPPFCDVASAWTFDMVASIRTYSKSGSMLNSLNKRSHTPARDQRRKRV